MEAEHREINRSQALTSSFYKWCVVPLGVGTVIFAFVRDQWALWLLVAATHALILGWIFADCLSFARMQNIRRNLEALRDDQPWREPYRAFYGTKKGMLQSAVFLAMSGIVFYVTNGDAGALLLFPWAACLLVGTANHVLMGRYLRRTQEIEEAIRPRFEQ